MVSAVIDLDKLYRDAGLYARDLPIDVAISGRDGQGQDARSFFGDARVFDGHPVTRFVSVPSGVWTIAATPKGGWDAALAGRWWARLVILFAGAVVVAPAWLAGRLVEERRAHFDRLADREGELERLSRRLELALDASKVGVWEFNIDTRRARLGRPDERALRLPLRRRTARATAHWRDRLDRGDSNAPIADFETAIRSTRPLRIAISARPRRRAQRG